MAKAPFSDLLLYLRKVCGSQAARDLTDAELLERFRFHRDEVSFSVLVHRHGPMVLAACRRVLGHSHGTEDAFQATFMVLVRRLASISCTGSLGGWLQAVAQRVATKARNQETARRRREGRLDPMPAREPLDDVAWEELRGVLDEEIARLAEKYRAPLVLCYLEGKSYDQAARELGWPKSSLAKRLARARDLLRRRLVRRGVSLSAGALVSALCEKVSGAPVGAMLVINTVKAAMIVAAGKAVAGGCLSAEAMALAEEVAAGMLAIQGKLVILTLVLTVAIGSAGLAGYGAFGETSQPAKIEKPQVAPAQVEQLVAQNKEAVIATDLYGDSLPAGAVGRLGTVRFRPGWTFVLKFAPDGKTLASGGTLASGICLWDVATGRRLYRVGIRERTMYLAFSPDGKKLFNGGDKSLLEAATGKLLQKDAAYVWDAEIGKPVDWLKIDGDTFNKTAFSKDNKILAAAGLSGIVRLYDPQTRKEIRHWRANSGAMYSVALSSDGKLLASVGAMGDITIRIWDTDTGEQTNSSAVHTNAPHSLSFSADGKSLFSYGDDQRVIEWDLATSHPRDRFLVGPLGPPVGGYGSAANSLSPDSTVLAQEAFLAVGHRAIRLLDTVSGKEIRTFGQVDLIRELQFSPSGKLLASASAGGGRDPDGSGGLHLWDPVTGKKIRTMGSADVNVGCICFSPDEKLLASVDFPDFKVLPNGTRYKIRLWEIATGKQLHMWEESNPQRVLAFSPDSSFLAFKSQEGVRIQATATGKELARLPCLSPSALIETLAFSASGRILATVESYGSWPSGLEKTKDAFCTIRLWDALTAQEIRHIQVPPESFVESLAFSPDGRTLASGGSDSAILLWDVTAPATAGNAKTARLSADELNGLWSDLASDGAKADQAIWTFARAPRQGGPFLQERLRLVPAPAEQVAKLMADLDSNQFVVRQKAQKALVELGEAAEAALRKNLNGKAPLEVQQRIEQILEKGNKEVIRKLRAIEALEHIGTAEARQVLQELAKGAPNPRLRDAASAALKRLAG